MEYLLEKSPVLRDNDQQLITEYWYLEMVDDLRLKVGGMSAMDMIRVINSKQLTSSESIRRARQTVQHNRADLRGFSYKKRLERQGLVKGQIKELEVA